MLEWYSWIIVSFEEKIMVAGGHLGTVIEDNVQMSPHVREGSGGVRFVDNVDDSASHRPSEHLMQYHTVPQFELPHARPPCFHLPVYRVIRPLKPHRRIQRFHSGV